MVHPRNFPETWHVTIPLLPLVLPQFGYLGTQISEMILLVRPPSSNNQGGE